MSDKVRIFVSYKHDPQDEGILKGLMEHIYVPITNAGGEFWFDRKLMWGSFWDAEIKDQLARADIALVLVSQRYLNSVYIHDVEISALVRRRTQGKLTILPLLLRPCDWTRHEWLRSTQFLPLNGENVVSDYPENNGKRDELFQQVLEALRDHVEKKKRK